MSQSSRHQPVTPSPSPNYPDAELLSSPPSTRILIALVAAYVLLTLALILAVPMGGAPDESEHIQYVRHLAETGQLPVFLVDGGPPRPGENPPHYEYHQPPLYYLLCVPFWKVTPPAVQPYLCRLVALFCGAATLVFLWYAVAALFPDNLVLPVMATGFAALWPLHQGVGASAGNDALAGLITGALFFMIALGAARGWRLRDLMIVGGLCGLGLLTKSTCLVMLFLAMAVAWQVCRRRESPDEPYAISPVLASAVILGVALLVSGWWLWRNHALYGDPFALGIFNRAFGNAPSAQLMQAVRYGLVSFPQYLFAMAYLLFCTGWGIFGGPETARQMFNPFGSGVIKPAALPALIPMFICLAATLLTGVGLLRFARKWKEQESPVRIALFWWITGFILVSMAFVSFNLTYFQAQARYFHTALLPMSLFFALGWQQFWDRAKNPKMVWAAGGIFAATLVAITLWNVLGWRTLV